MTDLDYELEHAATLSARVVAAIRSVDDAGGYVYANEYDLQDALSMTLLGAGLEVVREVILPGGNRIDFFALLPTDDEHLAGLGVGIEVKVKGDYGPVYRQLRRYADVDIVRGLILVTTRASKHHGLPKFFRSSRPSRFIQGRPVIANIPLTVVGLTGAAL